LPRQSRVTLHIYDVGKDTWSVGGANKLLKALGTGAFHTAVEVSGMEWSYGASSEAGTTGVYSSPPGGDGQHQYREAMDLGSTPLSNEEVDEVLQQLKAEWHGADYDLLRRNCCHFCDALCLNLSVGPLPSWVKSLAGAGAALDAAADVARASAGAAVIAAAAKAKNTAEAAAAVAAEVSVEGARQAAHGARVAAREVRDAYAEVDRRYDLSGRARIAAAGLLSCAAPRRHGGPQVDLARVSCWEQCGPSGAFVPFELAAQADLDDGYRAFITRGKREELVIGTRWAWTKR